MIALAASMMLAAADVPKIRPMHPAEYAARCKAAARVMQDGLSIPTDGWRDYQRDITYWEGRHRDAQGDPARREAQDADALARFRAAGPYRNHHRAAASPIAGQCRQQREAAGQ